MMRDENRKLKRRIAGWSLATFAVAGLFSYLTFVPEQVSAAYDWETRKLSGISTMQEMNAKICENSGEHEAKQLEDTREPGKTYWVTKLKDGNCWMTQNLDYDGGGTATPITSWPSSGTVANYYDPGNVIYTYSGHGQIPSNTCSGVTAFSDSKCTSYFTTKANPTAEEMHYHAGNYYSWNAAVNGTGVVDGNNITSGEASGSICPSGWKLPTSNNTNKGSFAYLLTQYGVQSSLTSGSNSIYGDPLYFVYGGDLYSGQLSDAGRNGYYWSSTPHSDGANAYALSFAGSVNPSNNFRRYNGFSVRCVARDDVYPEEPPLDSNSQANVAITVSPVISIDVTQHVDEEVDFTRVAKSEIVARVGSNQPYQVLLSTDKSALTNDNIEQSIPMITTDQKIVAGTSNWGIKKLASASDTTVNADTVYSPVGIGDNKALFYTSNVAAAEDLTFPVAIAVDAALPMGQYSTQVTLTAVAM